MLELFNRYKDAGKISEALMVGRNMFNRNPDNAEFFDAYYSYLCTLAETLPSFSDRSHFAEQASVALAFYTENAILTESVVSDITAYQFRLDNICGEIDNIQQEKTEKETKEIEHHNSECLKNLYALKNKLQRVSNQVEFDVILAQIGQVDAEIIKDNFTHEQSDSYNALTKDHTELISSKMRELEYKKNIVYNKQAADSFAKAFNQFRNNEGKYKNQTQLFSLVSTTLFAYDVSRLFNETLIYYNHVYSYIFSKLDDDGKLAITRFSIECERKLR
ncbi:hypothetical protein [Anaerotignum faecicola]